MENSAHWVVDGRPLIVKSQKIISDIKKAQSKYHSSLTGKSINRGKTLMTAIQDIVQPVLAECDKIQLDLIYAEVSFDTKDIRNKGRALTRQSWEKDWKDKLDDTTPSTKEQKILYKFYGQTILFEKNIKGALSGADEDDIKTMKNIFTTFLLDFFAYISIPLFEK